MHKLFISYSHSDEATVNDFIKFTAPINSGDKAMFELWHDRKIRSGTSFWDEIRKKINEVDGAILFISADYLNSSACIEEKDMFIRLHEERGFIVLPLIVKKCLWMEHPDLKQLLALTTDAKPLSDFTNKEDAWMDVTGNLKKSLEMSSPARVVKTSPNTITISLSFTVEKDKFHILQDIFQQMNMALSVVNVSHFDGNPLTACPVYQISGTPSCIADTLHRIHEKVGAESLTDIRYLSEVDSFERDNLTLIQTIQLLDHIILK